MQLLAILQQYPLFLIIVVGIFSLLIGSFLNAAIYRIPVMLEREWDDECDAHINQNNPDFVPKERERFNLFVPRSICPTCNHKISSIENIPVLSYLVLRGNAGAVKQAYLSNTL